ncbi:MAG: type III-B CRISPR module RAMP protein Cmr4 [Deltaproteobacteria bacterium]|nr:MAG: type III-B CRISPR module RAMP protein Cmr4 [Deltaproteobacteria bacterium]
MQTRLVVVHALSPLHAGTGQGTGHIDLPVQRDRASRHPLLPGSSIKGCLRDRASGTPSIPSRELAVLFGPDFAEESDTKAREREARGRNRPDGAEDKALPSHFAAALRFSDARVVLFPVQSDRGTFAWVTCPYVLERLRRDVGPDLSGLTAKSRAPGPAADGQAAVASDSVLVSGGKKGEGGKVILDGLPFTSTVPEGFDRWAGDLASRVFPGTDAQAVLWQGMLRRRLCIVDDDSFTWFVEQATEVRARIRINDATGTVTNGGLWYEECLPAETVLMGLVQHVPQKDSDIRLPHDRAWSVLSSLVDTPMQLGGKATVGHGLARVHLVGGAG